ncbi:hypothetical protein P3T22_001017 [Paraburkholderia sp. GAS348]|jgi:hypothetical protein
MRREGVAMAPAILASLLMRRRNRPNTLAADDRCGALLC